MLSRLKIGLGLADVRDGAWNTLHRHSFDGGGGRLSGLAPSDSGVDNIV